MNSDRAPRPLRPGTGRSWLQTGATLLVAGSLLTFAASPASAQSAPPSSTTGTAQTEVIEPSRLMHLRDLRFGAFARPTAAATMTVAPNGNVTATGQVATTMNITQPPSGRGPALFRIDGTPNRAVVIFYPSRITISNGSATMRVDNIAVNVTGRPRINSLGVLMFNMGGRLNVAANQAPGSYTGDFTITVIFQ